MVVRLGKEADSGHYICHLLDNDDRVVTVNDTTISLHSWKEVQEDISTQRQVQIFLYSRANGEIGESFQSKGDPWSVDSTQVLNIRQCWIEERIHADPHISCEDFQTIHGDNHLNDNIMNSFLRNISASNIAMGGGGGGGGIPAQKFPPKSRVCHEFCPR